MSSEAEEAWRAIYGAYTGLGPKLDKRLKESVGLTYSEYEALSQLRAAGGPVTMSDLASFVAVTRTHASRLIGALEGAGLATREPNQGDKRVVLVAITGEGVRRLQRAESAVEAVFAESLGTQMSGKELRQLKSLVDRASDSQT